MKTTYHDRVTGKTLHDLFDLAHAIRQKVEEGLERGPFPTEIMWAGHGGALCVYGIVVAEALSPHGQDLLRFFVQAQYMMTQLGERIEKPDWGCPGKPRKGVRAEVKRTMNSDLTCIGCNKKTGYKNRGNAQNQWWVCATCGRPTEQWLRAQGDTVLNMFRGGPVDGLVYSTSLLLSVEGLRIPVREYVWTEETVKSERTGRVARVWLYQPSQTPGSVAFAGNTDRPTRSNGARTMSTETTESATTPEPQPQPQAAPEPVDTSDLETRRKALKASRTQVAQEANITVAQLYRIEKGGPRTTADEAKVVRDALTRLEESAKALAEQQAAAAAQAQPAEAGAADPS